MVSSTWHYHWIRWWYHLHEISDISVCPGARIHCDGSSQEDPFLVGSQDHPSTRYIVRLYLIVNKYHFAQYSLAVKNIFCHSILLFITLTFVRLILTFPNHSAVLWRWCSGSAADLTPVSKSSLLDIVTSEHLLGIMKLLVSIIITFIMHHILLYYLQILLFLSFLLALTQSAPLFFAAKILKSSTLFRGIYGLLGNFIKISMLTVKK